MTTPLLIFSDHPAAPTGLARITRDIATRLAKNLPGLFKVATIGYGSPGSARLPFQQYNWHFRDDFVIGELPEIWNDFAGSYSAPGLFFTVHDASRMLWLVRPEQVLEYRNPRELRLAHFVKQAPFLKVGYFPIDAAGIDGKFTLALKETYRGYDRVLAYTEWARKLLENTLAPEDVKRTGLSYLPHGVDTSVFYPRDRREARESFFKTVKIEHQLSLSDKLVIGIVATNQPRKDYGLAFAALREVAKTREIVIWIKTDILERHWSLPGLAGDFALRGFVTVDEMEDEAMARAYSACDVCIAPGLGEGFGYPIFEALACGCPVVHGEYGGAAEFMSKEMLIQPVAMRLETPYSVYRPVYEPLDMAKAVLRVTDQEPRRKSLLPERLAWSNLWPEWERWFKSLAAEKRMEAKS